MKIFLALLSLTFFIPKCYSQADKHIRQIDSLVSSINNKRKLVSKQMNDTSWLGYSNGFRVIGHYFTLKCQFEKDKPKQLVKVTREKVVYYYNLNELIKVENKTGKPEILYFRNGQALYSNTSKNEPGLLSNNHLEYAKRYLDKFLSKG